MKIPIHIPPYAIRMVIMSIMLVLLTSCKATQENAEILPEAENGSQSVDAAENDGAWERNSETLQNAEASTSEPIEPKAQADMADEAANLEAFENNGLKLLYPSGWSLTDRTDMSKQIDKNIITEYYISSQKDSSEPRVGVRVAEDISDGGIEKRKEEANMYFERMANTDEIVFEDIVINGCDFYKISYPYGDNFQEILLIAVKNNKRYDVWGDFNKESQEETEWIDDIINSIVIED